MFVVKFGGTSLDSAQKLQKIFSFVLEKRSTQTIIIVSAVGETTKLLQKAVVDFDNKGSDPKNSFERIKKIHIKIAHNLGIPDSIFEDLFKDLEIVLKNCLSFDLDSLERKKEFDKVLSFGENLSAKMMGEYFTFKKIENLVFGSGEIGIVTNNNFGSAEILIPESEKIIAEKIKKHKEPIIIVGGFVGRTIDNDITTTGFNSSDYTACIVAAAVKCHEVYICTDVDGVMSADPKIVSNIKFLPSLSFEEALEISGFGGKILHPNSVRCCLKKKIKLKVFSLSGDLDRFTAIDEQTLNKPSILAIGFKKNVALFRVCSSLMMNEHGLIADVFGVIKKYMIPVNAISTSRTSISFAVDLFEVKKEIVNIAIKNLKKIGRVSIKKNVDLLSVIVSGGYLTKDTDGLLRITNAINKENFKVLMLSQGFSGVSLSMAIETQDLKKNIISLHKNLIEAE